MSLSSVRGEGYVIPTIGGEVSGKEAAAAAAALAGDNGDGECFIRIGKSLWFSEAAVMWKGQRMCIELQRDQYFCTRTGLQNVLVADTVAYGRMMVLDGVIQITSVDEAAYQEMLAHLPLFSHPKPQRVCVIGGGDGGILREVMRHPSVEEVTICEIDGDLLSICQEHLSQSLGTHDTWRDQRLHVKVLDGAAFLAAPERRQYFDVVIVDSSDPVGPAETLYTAGFLASVHSSLRPGGVYAMQGECLPLHLPLIQDTLKEAATIFGAGNVDYAYTCIPTYPSGQIGFIMARKGTQSLRTPVRSISFEMQAELKYYSHSMHMASFEIPAKPEKELLSVRARNTGTPAGSFARQLLALGDQRMACWGFCAAAFVVGVAVGAGSIMTCRRSR